MIWCCECLCGCAALLPPHKHFWMSHPQLERSGSLLCYVCPLAAVLEGIAVPCLTDCIRSRFQGVNPLCHHNFQHWMSWLG